MRIAFVLFTPFLIAPLVMAMVVASHSFQNTYSETLCRMESVRTHAIEDIQKNKPMEANFGGDECLTPMIPTVAVSLDPAIDPTPTAVPDLSAP
jgi:hypothetical protein